MIEGLLHHTLSGIRGFSYLGHSTIDVAKVLNVSYRKRLFMIFDREYPYTLVISYKNILTTTSVSPVFVNGQVGHVYGSLTTTESIITKRYKGKREVFNEIQEIERKQKALESMGKKLSEILKNF